MSVLNFRLEIRFRNPAIHQRGRIPTMGEKQPEKGSQKPKGDPNMAIYSTYYENFFQKELLGDDNVATLKAKYDGAAPFEHTVIPNVFDIDLLKSVRKEISEHLHFTQKETDIYKIHQTGDLRNLSGLRKSELKRLYNLRTVRNSLYSREFREFISRVTGCGPLSVTRQDLAINVYQKGCYLLPHDDVIGTRRVSFILYLTDPKDVWEPSRGGALRLYPVQTLSDPSHEELVSIPPSFNHLALFAVQPGRSYHDVEEIYHDSPRLAISGWFHLPQSGEMDYDADVVEHAVEQSSLQQLNSKKHEADIPKISFNPFDENELDDILSEEEIDYLKDHLNPELLTPDAVEQLSNTFAEESTLRIYNFLNIPDSFAQEIVGIDKGSIKDSGFPVAGPLYKQKYCYATKDQPHCQAFHYVLGELFTHPAFRHWLKLACGVTPMSYSVQGRVFRKGSDYTLATAHEGSRPILEATLGLTPNDEGWGDGEFGGYEIYLSPDEDKKQDPAVFSHWRPKEKSQEDHILLTTGPSWNALTLVFREPEVLKFVKYCSKAAPGNRWDAVAQYHIANEDIEKDEEDETDVNKGESSGV